jgi:hypothetical protein
LISSHFYQDGIDQLQLLKLKNLNNKEAVELFIHKVPSRKEIYKIFKWELVLELDEYTKSIKKNFQSPKCQARHTHNITCIKEYLAQHPLFEILKGMPLAVSIVASQVMSFSLKEIY